MDDPERPSKHAALGIELFGRLLDERCSACDGAGLTGFHRCTECDGTGFKLTEDGKRLLWFINRHLPFSAN